jgi:hypothetical protein
VIGNLRLNKPLSGIINIFDVQNIRVKIQEPLYPVIAEPI